VTRMFVRLRRCLALLTMHFLTVPGLVGQGARPQEAIRVTVLQAAASPAAQQLVDGLRRRFEQVGRRSVVTIVSTEGDGGVRAGSADLVIALGARAASAAARDYRGIPSIGALVTRESAQPAGGTASSVVLEFSPEVELDWIRRMLPQARRIGVLYSSDANARLVARARDIGRAMGLEIVARRIASPSEIPAALNAMAGDADVLWGVADDLVLTPETAKAVLLSSLRTRLPFVGLSAQWVRAGAVYALDRDYTDMGAQTADLAVRLLDGTPSRALEAVTPRKVVYSLNLRSAALMRVTIPDNLMRGASEIFR
jgi:putative tryptophan/tyrosine transport system substrate-binding protein